MTDESWDDCNDNYNVGVPTPTLFRLVESDESDDGWGGIGVGGKTPFFKTQRNNRRQSNENGNFRGGRGNFRNNGDRSSHSNGGNRYGERRSYNSGSKTFRSSTSNGFNKYENADSETINVPSKFIGKIIGRGGSKVKDLQHESGAKIQVTKDIVGEDTVIKLFGIKDAREMAKSMINDLIYVPTITIVPAEVVPPPEEKPLDWKAMMKECDEYEAEKWSKYPDIVKEFYVEHADVTNMTEEDVNIFRETNNNIIIERTFKNENSKPLPKPCPTFMHAFHNYPEILNEIVKAGFEKPSPIQSQAWPVLLGGEDLIGIAQTGTGKTLAFILPALIHIDGQSDRSERDGPAVLIMAPTRELALQIDKEVKKYQYKGITSLCVYGGGDRSEQIEALTAGVDIVIATPGRLNDLLSAGHFKVETITYAVLDEADRMLDMGFEGQIRRIMYMVRPTRQTVMTSATWPAGVRRLAESYMKDPVQIYIGSLDLAATHTVTQNIELVSNDDDVKMQKLFEFVNQMKPNDKVIIFCGRKSRADQIASDLSLLGVKCGSLHGDRDQGDREQALLDISDGTVKVLVATDLASRGLDIDDITYVVNFDFPRNIEEYVHRVGRTGRAGKAGVSISYFTSEDWGQATDLINILEEAQQYVPQELYSMAERYACYREKKASSGRGRGRGRGRQGRGGRW